MWLPLLICPLEGYGNYLPSSLFLIIHTVISSGYSLENHTFIFVSQTKLEG